MISWSNPDPSKATSAALSADYRVQAGDIGPLVHAILQYREQQAQQQQKSFDDMISGIGKGVSGAYGAYQGAQADDAANAAIYGRMYPQDAASAYSDPGRVPDYGGVTGLQSWDRLNLDPAMEQARLAAIQAKTAQSQMGPQMFTAPDGSQYLIGPSGGMHPLGGSGASTRPMTPRQQITTANDAQKAAQDYYDQFGIPEEAINNPSAIHGPSDTPYSYRKGDKATTVPKDQLLVVDPKTGEYNYVTPDYLNQARTALEQFKAAQGQYRNALGLPQQLSGATPGVRQTDVDQAAQAQGLKPLDADTAKQFLEAAGGNKDMARKLARDAGYSF